jgi:hypothetical protein
MADYHSRISPSLSKFHHYLLKSVHLLVIIYIIPVPYLSLVKGIHAVRIEIFFILKVANIRCFIYILIAVEIFHNIIRK